MYKWGNMVFYAAMVVINGLSAFGKLNGITTAEVSEEYGSLITPAGWTFSIWGVIYALLLILIVVPFISPDSRIAEMGKSMAIWFPVSCALNILWIITWHGKQIVLSWITMIALFLTLYIMFNKTVTEDMGTKQTSLSAGRILANAGISAYFGWICVALLANTMAMLVDLGMDGYGIAAKILTPIMLLAGALLISFLSTYSGNLIFTLAGMWGYVGILYKHMAKSGYNGEYIFVILAAFTGLLIIAGGTLVALISKYNKPLKTVS